MKKATIVLFLASLAATAGPLKLASQPFRHPIKDQRALMNANLKVQKAVGKALFKTVKALVW